MTTQQHWVVKNDLPDERIVMGEVYAPNRPDADGEYMTADTIKKMAHDFAKAGRLRSIDVMHDNKKVHGPCIVESFIARKGDPDFLEGSWVIGMHIPNDDLWDRAKKGDLNGFSLEAFVGRQDVEREVEIPEVVSGHTTKNEDHTHVFQVRYDDQGRFLGGATDVVNGHSHHIKAGTHTETERGHRHRFSAVDALQIVD